MELMARYLGVSFSAAEAMHCGLRVFYVHVRKRCVMAVYSDTPEDAFQSSDVTDMAREMIEMATVPWLERFDPARCWSKDAKAAQAQVLDAFWEAYCAYGESG